MWLCLNWFPKGSIRCGRIHTKYIIWKEYQCCFNCIISTIGWVQGDSIKLYHQLPERPSYYPTDQDQQEPTIKAQDQDIPSQLCHQIPDDLEHQDFYLNFLPTQQTFSQGWREWGKIKIRNLFKMNKMGPGPSRRTRRASSWGIQRQKQSCLS